MTEENKKHIGLSFHKLYSYIYLPLFTILTFFIAAGKLSQYRFITLSSVMGWLDFLDIIFPGICFILYLVTLPLLLAMHPWGRRLVLFSETFKALLSLTLLWKYLLLQDSVAAVFYSCFVVLLALVYAYYSRRRTAFLSPRPTVREVKIEEHEERATEETVKEKGEENKTEESEEETVPEVSEEKIEEEPTEIAFSEGEEEVKDLDVEKLVLLSPSVFEKESPIILREMRISILRDHTAVKMTILNRSAVSYSSSIWEMNGVREITLSSPIPAKKETALYFSLTQPTDRIDLTLLSLTGEDDSIVNLPKERTLISLPERIRLEALRDDEDYASFIGEYRKKENIEALWCASENIGKTAILCPRCSSPILIDEEECPVCSLKKEAALRFSPSLIQSEYDRVKAE